MGPEFRVIEVDERVSPAPKKRPSPEVRPDAVEMETEETALR